MKLPAPAPLVRTYALAAAVYTRTCARSQPWIVACGAPITSKDGNFTLQQPGTYLPWAYAQSGTPHMIEVRVRE